MAVAKMILVSSDYRSTLALAAGPRAEGRLAGMQRRLVIVRHAKTGEGSPDIARELTDRGRRDAQALGRWLAENDVVPDLVVVSPARRAQQTWDLAARKLPTQPEIRVDDRIYDNTVDDVLAAIRETANDVTTLAVVGHNPSLGELAGVSSFPTAAVAVFDLPDPWLQADLSAVDATALATCRA
jgi:phosphohistidine phosphatase